MGVARKNSPGVPDRNTCAEYSLVERSVTSPSKSCATPMLKFIPMPPSTLKGRLQDSTRSVEHSLVDMGSDEFTLGKPHPMIDGTLRKQRILAEAHDPQTAILFLDFILGYNASMDPVGELLDAILEARQIAKKRGGHLTVVASICGTDGDPQDLKLQVKLLKEAGVIVFSSNASATSFCAALLN